jgi:hypothetical protein
VHDPARVTSPRRLARRGWLGLLLVAVLWPANWFLPGLRTHVLFFPLWLGALAFVDAWTERRDGSSLATRSPRGFLALFALSIPLWWLFEGANAVLANWEYRGRERFGALEYALWCSLAFSSVVPAILVLSEWARGLRWLARGPWRARDGWSFVPSRRLEAGLLALGAALLFVTLRWPRACYPLVWVAGVFLLEPLARWRGRPALLGSLGRGDGRPSLALAVGGLACGFLWELWNARSYPKWIYHTPGVDGPRLFEMPLLGYLGYLPFALAVYQWKELWLREPELLSGPPTAAESR